jgi:thymidylate synthase (FAD)
MKVTVIAATQLVGIPDSIGGTKMQESMWRDTSTKTDIDLLHEFAGRGCYKSWNKPNPKTEANEDYLAHIIESAHVSVLEHGQVSLYVENVSRSLLLELERHGRNSHLSFSVESQRYVSTSKHHPSPIVPPLFYEAGEAGQVAKALLQRHYDNSLRLYDQTYSDLRDAGIGVKQAREAARAFLPNATPVDFVVTADIRGWREVIEKRNYEGADAEIQAFAQMVEEAITEYAPASMQGIAERAA